MPEFLREEEEDEIYFGEDYYDENASDSEGEFEEQRAKDLAKIETARLKFATSRSLGVLPNNQRRDRE